MSREPPYPEVIFGSVNPYLPGSTVKLLATIANNEADSRKLFSRDTSGFYARGKGSLKNTLFEETATYIPGSLTLNVNGTYFTGIRDYKTDKDAAQELGQLYIP